MPFGLALLERLEGDAVLSPYGVARALRTIRDGATGETREALARIPDVPVVPGILSAQAAWLEPGGDLDELIHGPGAKALGRVLQRARVDVDEEGTRAAATTAVTARAIAYVEPKFKIVFDRPFTWAVEHAPSGTLLFAGRVRNPTERSD